MTSLSRRSLLLGSIGISALPKSAPEQVYLFMAGNYEVRMTLEFHDRYVKGLNFEERRSHREFCLSAGGDENRNCLGDFTGAIAIARYRVSSRAKPEPTLSLREYVRSIDQSDHVPVRPPFERTIEFQQGLASDIQVFGYKDSDPLGAASDDAWCLLRQNLYLGSKPAPFLVVHWKHTLTAIRILDVIPENGTSQLLQPAERRRR